MRISDWSSDVCSSDLNAGAARLGLGLAQAPRSRFEDDLASGALVEVLPEFAPPETPISVLYPNNRHLSQRVRVFVDWLVATLKPRLSYILSPLCFPNRSAERRVGKECVSTFRTR